MKEKNLLWLLHYLSKLCLFRILLFILLIVLLFVILFKTSVLLFVQSPHIVSFILKRTTLFFVSSFILLKIMDVINLSLFVLVAFY